MADTVYPPAPDQASRDIILNNIFSTILVEAGAGTGKTTIMVKRIVNLLLKGNVDIRNIAAVTFTRKAAAELKSRLQIELEKQGAEGDAKTKRVMHRALEHIHHCFLGTIHSFCGMILSERPVEASVRIGFRQIEDEEDSRLKREAWEEYIAFLYANDDPILPELEDVGLRVSDLEDTYEMFCEHPDISTWPSSDGSLPDLAPTLQALADYTVHMKKLLPSFPRERGNDKLMYKYETIVQMMAHRSPEQPAELMDILEYFGNSGATLKMWPGGAAQGKEEKTRWETFKKEHADPMRALWMEKRYTVVLKALRPAALMYENLRSGRGLLNFRDLLMKTAALLRDKPNIREYFSNKYTHLLVDEFQDTDPVQAEVIMLLAADSPEEQDWRSCRPRPGSLFVVGDPKQSIYRFRRADIQVYREVKELILNSGGLAVTLSANFRTVRPVIEWINNVFEDEFPKETTAQSPEYVKLQAGRPSSEAGMLTGTRTLIIPDDFRKADDIVDFESDRIASFIQKALDEKMSVPARPGEGRTERPVRPGDFLILSMYRRQLYMYARKLQIAGIPHEVTGGGSLNRLPELRYLYLCLRALTRPHDPVALVALLRSGLFGVSDRALYQFRKSGGEFNFRKNTSGSLFFPPEITDAFEKLNQYSLLFSRLPMVSAVSRVTSDLGLFAHASSKPGGDVEAGSLGKAIELIRSASREMNTLGELVEYIRDLVNIEEHFDGVSALSEDRSKVRIMNLHQAKGLEAPVVFLAAPVGHFKADIHLHVDRSGDEPEGYMAVYRKNEGSRGGDTLLAHPPGWESISEKEREFSAAEALRLQYVAATRAGSMLVASLRSKYPNENFWAFFNNKLISLPELEDCGKPNPASGEPAEFEYTKAAAFSKYLKKKWAALAEPSYRDGAAKTIGVERTSVYSGEDGTGAQWGSVIHTLLEIARKNPETDLKTEISNLLKENSFPPERAEEAHETVTKVMDSELWNRASKSSVYYPEMPFTLMLDTDKGPVLTRGVIDLVFKEDDRWVIADYKTDAVGKKGTAGLVDHYKGQLDVYRQAWEQSTGETVSECGIYFTSVDEYVKL